MRFKDSSLDINECVSTVIFFPHHDNHFPYIRNCYNFIKSMCIYVLIWNARKGELVRNCIEKNLNEMTHGRRNELLLELLFSIIFLFWRDCFRYRYIYFRWKTCILKSFFFALIIQSTTDDRFNEKLISSNSFNCVNRNKTRR